MWMCVRGRENYQLIYHIYFNERVNWKTIINIFLLVSVTFTTYPVLLEVSEIVGKLLNIFYLHRWKDLHLLRSSQTMQYVHLFLQQ